MCHEIAWGIFLQSRPFLPGLSKKQTRIFSLSERKLSGDPWAEPVSQLDPGGHEGPFQEMLAGVATRAGEHRQPWHQQRKEGVPAGGLTGQERVAVSCPCCPLAADCAVPGRSCPPAVRSSFRSIVESRALLVWEHGSVPSLQTGSQSPYPASLTAPDSDPGYHQLRMKQVTATRYPESDGPCGEGPGAAGIVAMCRRSLCRAHRRGLTQGSRAG